VQDDEEFIQARTASYSPAHESDPEKHYSSLQMKGMDSSDSSDEDKNSDGEEIPDDPVEAQDIDINLGDQQPDQDA
jgi:hypothetical protein